MLAKHREMLSHITGVLCGLSYVVEGNIADALLDCGDAGLQAVQSKAFVDVSTGCIALEASAATRI